jgi:hypothetical protein
MTRHDHQCPRRKGSPKEIAFNAPLPNRCSSIKPHHWRNRLCRRGFQDRYRASAKLGLRSRRAVLASTPAQRGKMHLAPRLALATSQRHAAKPEPRSLRRHERSFLLYSPYSFFDELSLSVPMLLKLFFLEQFLHSLCLFYPAPRASRWLPIGGESLHRSGEIVFVHFATIPPIEL